MIAKLTNWLYQGDIDSIKNLEYLNYPIRGIVCVCENNERIFPRSGNDINYLWCSFDDPGETLTRDKLRVISEFSRQEGTILVHCFGGINRSPAICVYLMYEYLSGNYLNISDIFENKNPHVRVRDELIEKIMQLSGCKIINP